jgi:SAM-dependent methyltransferase
VAEDGKAEILDYFLRKRMAILRKITRILKRVRVDLGQYEMRYTTKGKMIAWQYVDEGAGKTALDLGCRDGYWAEKLATKGYDVTAVDLRPKYSKATKVDANLALPFPTGSFDLVWCTEVIEHLRDPVFTLSEIRRVLKPGGKLLLTTPNDGCWIFRLLRTLGISSDMIENEEHEHFFTYPDIAKLLPGVQMFGYFPYLLYKRTITRHSDALSPTTVAVFCNGKRSRGSPVSDTDWITASAP